MAGSSLKEFAATRSVSALPTLITFVAMGSSSGALAVTFDGAVWTNRIVSLVSTAGSSDVGDSASVTADSGLPAVTLTVIVAVSYTHLTLPTILLV